MWTDRFRACALASLMILGGCGDTEEEAKFARKTIKIEEVPAPVMAAAKKAIPRIDFDEAWRNVDATGNTQSFEIRGRAANGKIREVRVSQTGEILEME